MTTPYRKDRPPPARSLAIYRRHVLYGDSTREIARDLGITHQRVSKICRMVHEWFRERCVDGILELKVKQTAVLEGMAYRAMQQFEKSCQPQSEERAQIVRKAKKWPDGEPMEDPESGEPMTQLVEAHTSRSEKESCGDPRFLTEARNALADIRKIWGADAPQKFQAAIVDDDDLKDRELIKNMPAEDREHLLAIYDRMRGMTIGEAGKN